MRSTSVLVGALVAIIIIAGAFGYYYAVNMAAISGYLATISSLSSVKGQIGSEQSQIQSLQSQLFSSQSQIESLQSQVSSYSSGIQSLNSTAVANQSRLNLLNTMISACEDMYSPDGTINGMIHAKQNLPEVLCVRFYYYNNTASLTLNPLDKVQLFGYRSYQNGTRLPFDASHNFTVAAQPKMLTLGGPSNESEGALVMYTLTPKENSNGTYILNFGWLYKPHSTQLFSGGKMALATNCGIEFLVVVGTGMPDYTKGITYFCDGTTIHSGLLFTKVVGIIP